MISSSFDKIMDSKILAQNFLLLESSKNVPEQPNVVFGIMTIMKMTTIMMTIMMMTTKSDDAQICLQMESGKNVLLYSLSNNFLSGYR